MPETKKSAKKIGGPFIASAVLCNSVTEDSDGIVSALRIVDEIRLLVPHDAPADFPSASKPVEIALFALIIIRRGDARRGKHELRLVMQQPDGKTSEMSKQDIEMPEYPNGAINIRIRLSMKLHSRGVFWIDVILGKERLTRMALNLLVLRTEAPDGQNEPTPRSS